MIHTVHFHKHDVSTLLFNNFYAITSMLPALSYWHSNKLVITKHVGEFVLVLIKLISNVIKLFNC